MVYPFYSDITVFGVLIADGITTNGDLTLVGNVLGKYTVQPYTQGGWDDLSIPTKLYVDTEIANNLAIQSLVDLDDVYYPSGTPVGGNILAYNDIINQWEPIELPISFAVTASRNSNSTNVYLNQDQVSMNVTPFILPCDCELKYLSASTNGSESWTAEVHVNGILVPGATLTLSAVSKGKIKVSPPIAFNEDDEVMLYCNGNTINRPKITAFFLSRFFNSLQSDLKIWYDSLLIKPSYALLSALNTLMFALESSGDLAEIDLFHVLGGMETDEQRLRPIISTSGLDFTPINIPILDIYGMTSGAGYLDLNWIPSTDANMFTASSSSFGIYKDSNITDVLLTSSGSVEFGPYTTTGLHYLHAFNQLFAGMQSVPYNAFSTISTFKTVIMAKRNGTTISLDTGGTANPITATESINGLSSTSLYLGTANGMAENGDGKTISMVVAGSGNISSIQFYTDIQAYMTTRGIAVTP